MKRTLFDDDQLALADAVRGFIAGHVADAYAGWEEAGIVDRELWHLAGKAGLLGMAVPESYGGGGVESDYRFNAVLVEELALGGYPSLSSGFGLHNDVVAPYLLELGTEEQKQRWLPGFCAGELVTAIAMTEPGAGSDLQGIRTTARAVSDGWILNGQKTFITNGIHADLVIVVAKTTPEAGAKGMSLFVVERGMPGFERGRNLDKIGMHAQDTAELYFTDVHVPRENLLGTLDGGFGHLMRNLPQERLSIAVTAVAAARAALGWTTEYVRERQAFGQSIGSFQNTRFVLAEADTLVDITQTYVDRCIGALNDQTLTAVDGAKVKYWATDTQKRVQDACLQLFGGYGYMREYPIARAWMDGRVQAIYGGTNEIMKEIIGRALDLGGPTVRSAAR